MTEGRVMTKDKLAALATDKRLEALRQKLREDGELLRKAVEACEGHAVSLKIKRDLSIPLKLDLYSKLHPDPEERKRLTEMIAKHEELQEEYEQIVREILSC